MPRRLRRSMLFHLSAAFAAGFLLLVGTLALVLEREMVRTVHAQVDKDLRDAVAVTRHRLDDDHYPIDKELLDLGDSLYLRLTDPEGRLLIESPHIQRLGLAAGPPSAPWSWAERLEGGPVPVKWTTAPWSGGRFLVVRDLHHELGVLQRFRATLGWSLAVLSLLAGGLGYVLVKLGLRPLRVLAAGAAEVGPESMARRIDPARLPRELEPLCRELNHTFQRVEDGYQRLTALNADLAHEMRTPLHSMKLELERLLGSSELPPEQEEALAGLAETAAHLAALLEQMLFLARVEDPARHLQRTAIDPGRLLEQARAPFLALAEEKGVRMTLRLSGHPALSGDPILLRRALHNLTANALRHSPEGTEVLLEARGEAHGTVLSVTDHGPGLPEAVKRGIGRRFLRAGPSHGGDMGGVGLGLAIVRGIADLHDANLNFQDASPSGCRATITFPAT